MSEKLAFEIELKTNTAKFANDVKSKLEDVLSTLGIGGVGRKTAIQSAETGSGMGSAVALGAAVGVGVGLLGYIVDVLKDFPMITAVMKLLRLLITVLLLPLIPILKPLLQSLAAYIKFVTPIMKKLAEWVDKFVGWTMDKIIMPKVEAIKTFWAEMKTAGKVVWDYIIYPAWNYLKDVGKWIWEKILSPAFGFLKNVGIWIWGIIWKSIIYLSSAGVWLWGIIKSPFVWLAEQIRSLWDYFKNLFSSSKSSSSSSKTTPTKVKDFIITPNGTLETSPADYIIGTKNPKAMSGGGVVNVNINNPSFRNENDIKLLVKEIEQRLILSMRRYNSYV